MKAMKKNAITNTTMSATPADGSHLIEAAIAASWSKVAPFWPLKNLIAVNPVYGFEGLPFV